ncbi:MAG: imidazolonepropionase [bacterium]|nr:imidazolonepropionase [bacterium]
MPLLITNIAQLVTLAGDSSVVRRRDAMCELAVVRDGCVLVDHGGNIGYSGAASGADLQVSLAGLKTSHTEIDAGGRCVTPGLVDSHTHLVFAGDRAAEFYRRCAGETYADIAKSGGGIASTVRATRSASEDELVELALARLERNATNGTTTVEIKSGYGLSRDDELKMLRAIRRLREQSPLNMFSTYMGAHSIPMEFANDRSSYVRQVVEAIPQIATETLAEFVDIFVDPLAFTHDEAVPIIEAAMHAGLKVKLHGDEFSDNQTAAFGVIAKAISIDHLGGISDAGIEALAASTTIATLLPGTMFFSGHGCYAPARRMIDAGCAVALASDLNPGSSHIYSVPFIMTLACLQMGMTAAEALTACTINAAHALGDADRIGSIEAGKRADLVIWDCDSYEQIPYHVGTNLAHTVICGGQVV